MECQTNQNINTTMKPENLTELNNHELQKKLKQVKTNKMIGATIIGLTLGIVIYSAVKNGFGFFTFSPLVLTYIITRNSKNNNLLEKEIQKELEVRNLQ